MKVTISTQERLLSGIQQAAFTVLQRYGLATATARKVSRIIVRQLAFAWQGSVIYIPGMRSHDIIRRNQQIADEFNGSNHAELSCKYGISIQWVYDIVRKMRASHRQPDLFAPDRKSRNTPPRPGALSDITEHAAHIISQQLPGITTASSLSLGKEIACLTSELRKGSSAYIKAEKTAAERHDIVSDS